jgi:SAM-dependent methyltransferase
MFEFHKNKEVYFNHQAINSERYILPFIEAKRKVDAGMRVLEIGCGEGGVLKPFLNKGCSVIGVELNESKYEYFKHFYEQEIQDKKALVINRDIYKIDVENDLGGKVDIIILKDVIEHIHNQEKLLKELQLFLKPKGVIFFGFPPWQMPFGGHQQVCKSKFLSRFPYVHLLPFGIYEFLLRAFNEKSEDFIEIKETGISIERFERIVESAGYNTIHKIHYLLNPIYTFKFNLRPLKQNFIVRNIPYFRNYVTTCVYYLIESK